MKGLLRSTVLLLTLGQLQVHANDENADADRPLSVSALKERAVAPRIFTVTAYVVEKQDTCPPCPPKALCETCVFGIYLADDRRPRRTGTSIDDGIYLRTNRAQEFRVGAKYRFRLRYRMEMNAAGAWRQAGPELIDFAPVRP